MVVKPLPAALRSKLQQHRTEDEIGVMDDIDKDFDYMDTQGSSDSLLVSSLNHRRTNENDDYAFLDEDLLKDENDEDVKESLQRNYGRRSQVKPDYTFDHFFIKFRIIFC